MHSICGALFYSAYLPVSFEYCFEKTKGFDCNPIGQRIDLKQGISRISESTCAAAHVAVIRRKAVISAPHRKKGMVSK